MLLLIVIIIQAIVHQIKNVRREILLLSELTFFNENDELGHSSS